MKERVRTCTTTRTGPGGTAILTDWPADRRICPSLIENDKVLPQMKVTEGS